MGQLPPPPPPRPRTYALEGYNGGVVYQGPALADPPPPTGIIPGRPGTGYTRRSEQPQRSPPRKIASACDLLARCVPYPDLTGPLTQPHDERPLWPLLYDEV